MSQYSASSVGVLIDTDHGEGWITFQWPHELYGYEELRIDLDGHCSRRMPVHSGTGPPDFVDFATRRHQDSLRPRPAQELQLEEEIEILFHLTEAEFDDVRRVVDYLNGTEAHTERLDSRFSGQEPDARCDGDDV
jgi:hypothetical protein